MRSPGNGAFFVLNVFIFLVFGDLGFGSIGL